MLEVKRLPGGHPVEVVGESFYEEGLRRLADGPRQRWASLRPETSNPYDKGAIAVWIDDVQVGHLSRATAEALAPVARRILELRCDAQVMATIGGSRGVHGVQLDLAGPDECLRALGVEVAAEPLVRGAAAPVPIVTTAPVQSAGSSRRGLVIVAGVLLLGYLLFAPKTTVSSSAATASQTARPTATPAWITLRPEQMILPPEEFPFTGWSVSLDRAESATSWRRNFTSASVRDVRVEVVLTVLSSGTEIEQLRGYLKTGRFCDAKLLDALTAAPAAPLGLGEVDSVCVYAQRNLDAQIAERILFRNTVIEIFVTAKTTATLPSAEVTRLVEMVARTQLAIVGRFAT